MFRRRVLAGRVGCVERTGGMRRCVSRTLQAFVAVLCALVVFGGCGRDRGPERGVVSGTVAYNGKPVSAGMIRFVPAPTSPAPVSVATIADGKYTVDTHGGVPVGTHKVQIEAFRKIGSAAQSAERLPPGARDTIPREQYLPAKFNASTQLEITIPSGSRAMTKDFDLRD
jgi:hypothetical protein